MNDKKSGIFMFFAAFLLPAWAFLAAGEAGAASNLSLEGFLGQVNHGHRGLLAAENIREGAAGRAQESLLVYRPNLFSNASYMDDRSQTAGAFVDRAKQITKDFQVGFSQATDFGLVGKLYYDLSRTDIYGAANPTFFPEGGSFWSARPYLELTESLWRNGFGSETKTTVELGEATAKATGFSQGFQATLIRADAERTYWQLVAARETVRVEKENLERAIRMRNYQNRRTRLDLVDKSDSLQAEAAFALRTLELKAAEDDAKSAARAFNLARGIESDIVSEELDPIFPAKIIRLTPPARGEMREDVRATQEQSHAARAAAKIGIEKQQPSLDVFSNINLSGRNPQFNPAFANSYGLDNNTTTVGVRFSTPLDFSLLKKNRAGYQKEIDAAAWQLERKVQEQESDWQDLVTRLGDSERRLELAVEIEAAQQQKMNFEKLRQEKGRTTTYQVITFEQDFAQSQLTRIRAELDVLNTYAQLKTYGVLP